MAFTLIFGSFFAPFYAEAGFFSSIFGSEVLASSAILDTDLSTQNSQNMGLLQANVSPLLVSQDKDTKADDVDPNFDINIVSDNALLPSTGPLGASDEAEGFDPSKDEDMDVYVVRQGDTYSKIAEMFEVSIDTILSVNDLEKGSKPHEGDVLLILPFSGVEYSVEKGDTLQGIATRYKVDISKIIAYNIDLKSDTKLAIGDKLIIPGADMISNAKPSVTVKASPSGTPSSITGSSKNLSGYFINPVPGYRLSQGLHDGNAVDLAIASGTPIHASASGRVTFAKMGYNGGFGGLVIIVHPNGTQTYYAHQSKIATHVGAEVSQGEVIGYVGSTGRSTGPHLHFAVKGAANPGRNNSWAK